MNRRQRRMAARTRAQVPMVRMGELTCEEADLLQEACDLYRVVMDDPDADGYVAPAERTPLQQWAYERAGTIRDALQAAVEGRPWHDTRADRLPDNLQT